MRHDSEDIFPRRSRVRTVLIIVWLAGLIGLASVRGLFPQSVFVQRYLIGPHGIFWIMWIVAYLGVTWIVLNARRGGRF